MAVTLDSLKKAIKKNKGRSQALAWLADMERASGDYEAALKTVDAALAASPSDVPAMLVRAKILAGQQDFAGSITEYKKVIAKDPFCLAAHKRLGESYDKLGKEAERNACFRRVHDMDPLDAFWKDEYDVQTEEDQSVATMAPPPMDDESSFTMDLGNEPETAEPAVDAAEDNVFADLAASLSNTDDEDSSSMDALRDSLDIASDELAKSLDGTETHSLDDSGLNTSEVTSAISGILGGDEDFDLLGGASKKEDSASSSLFSSFSDDEEKKNLDEPAKPEELFESLVEDKPSEVVEEAPSENLFNLDSLDEPQVAEEPADKLAESAASPMHMDFSDEETETSSAEADLFNLDETPKAEEEPLMVDEPPKVEEAPVVEEAPKVAETPKTEEPETNVNDAFSSIFGEDDLPEESLTEKPAADDSDLKFEEPAAELAQFDAPAEPAVEEPVAEKNDSVSFDELVEEDSFGSLFEKSADADFSMDEKPAETSTETATLSDVKPAEVAGPAEEASFGGLFEKSADADFSMDETPAEQPVEEVTEESKPSESDVPATHMAFTEEESPSKLDDNFVLDLDEPAEETVVEKAPVFEEPAAEVAAEKSPVVEESVAESAVEPAPVAAENSAEDVDGAFDALFGDEEDSLTETASTEPAKSEAPADIFAEEDELVAEKPVVAEPAAEAPVIEEAVSEKPIVEETETLAEAPVAEEAAPAEVVQEPAPAPAPAAAKEEDVAKEMGGAFASMFGDEDDLDLPEEKSVPSNSAPSSEPAEVALTEEPLSQEATGAVIEESSVKQDVKDNVEESVEESFDNIFGSADDDLPEESLETVAKAAPAAAPAEKPAPVEQPVEAEKPVAEVEKPAEKAEKAPSAELDSIDSEVSNAFAGLFDEDDSLAESDVPNNKGVDYLMSGDSDDEVSASLVNNAEAPLSRGAPDLDDSLNTRTLADIYMEQGVYNKALEIYADLAKKDPDNAEIKSRLNEIEKLCREKFGEG